MQSLEKEKKSLKKIKNVLILCCRLLAILFLVLAFSQPYTGNLSNSMSGNDTLMFLYIDNSNSMSAKGSTGELLSSAKENAKKIVSKFPPGQKYIVSSNELSGIQEKVLNQKDALFEIDKISYSPIQRNLNTVINWQKEVSEKERKINNKLSKFTYIFLSDFQRNFFTLKNVKKDSKSLYNMIQFTPQNKSNCFVDSVWFESPVHRINEENELHFRVVNLGGENIVNLEVNVQAGTYSKDLFIDVAKGKKVTSSVPIRNEKEGPVFGKIEIRDLMMYWDDIFYFSYNIEPSNEILIINGKDNNSNVSKAYATEGFFKIEEVNQNAVNRNLFKNKNLVVLNGISDISSGLTSDIISFCDMGGTLFFIPGKNLNKGSINILLEKLKLPIIERQRAANLRVNRLATKDPFFVHVFEKTDESLNLPYFSKIYSSNYKSSSAIPLLFLRDESPVLFKSFKNSFALYSDLSPESNDLINNTLFPVVCIRIAELAKRANSLYSDIGQIQLIPLKTNYNSEQPIKLKSKETEFIPRIIQNGSYKFIDLSGPEVIERLKDGNYRIVSDEIIGNLSLNVNRKESSVHLMSQEGIISEFKDKKITNVQANKFSKSFDVTKINLNLPAEYWRICIFIAIMSVISEILISKFWKS
jgi:hypothetical protein